MGPSLSGGEGPRALSSRPGRRPAPPVPGFPLAREVGLGMRREEGALGHGVAVNSFLAYFLVLFVIFIVSYINSKTIACTFFLFKYGIVVIVDVIVVVVCVVASSSAVVAIVVVLELLVAVAAVVAIVVVLELLIAVAAVVAIAVVAPETTTVAAELRSRIFRTHSSSSLPIKSWVKIRQVLLLVGATQVVLVLCVKICSAKTRGELCWHHTNLDARKTVAT